MGKSTFVRFLASLCLLAFMAGGCTDRRSSKELKDTLIYAFADNFKTFDPAKVIYAQETPIIHQVLEPLVRWNNDLKLVPHLATSWETIDGCQTWIFHLRAGVKFHDGTPFDAYAVKTHFERILDPATAATRRNRIEEVLAIQAADPLTVVFRLKAPNCVFPETLTNTFTSIPSPTAIANKDGDFAHHPVGTGPFKFVEWKHDVRIVLERNPDYWNADAIKLQRVEFWPVRENTTRLILLEQGVVDMADIAFAQVNVAKLQKDLNIQTTPQLSIRYIGFNNQKPPFNDVRVRRAANYAVNKEEMIKYMLFGVGEPAVGPMPSVMEDFNPHLTHYDYNPEKAKELLKEAGYPNGIKVTMWTQESGIYRSASDAVVEYLRQVGIDVEMKILDSAVYWDKFDEYLKPDGTSYPTKEGVYDLYVGGWSGGEAAQDYLDALFRSRSYSNSSFYSSPDIDRMLDEFKHMVKKEDRSEAFRQMQKILVDDAPWIFAFHGQSNVGMRKRVKGFRINPSQRLFLEGVSVSDNPEER